MLERLTQTAVVEEGAIEPLVDLLSEAQPDGQYSAAAALLNLAGAGSDVRRQIVDSQALGPLVNMLTADSWCALWYTLKRMQLCVLSCGDCLKHSCGKHNI